MKKILFAFISAFILSHYLSEAADPLAGRIGYSEISIPGQNHYIDNVLVPPSGGVAMSGLERKIDDGPWGTAPLTAFTPVTTGGSVNSLGDILPGFNKSVSYRTVCKSSVGIIYGNVVTVYRAGNFRSTTDPIYVKGGGETILLNTQAILNDYRARHSDPYASIWNIDKSGGDYIGGSNLNNILCEDGRFLVGANPYQGNRYFWIVIYFNNSSTTEQYCFCQLPYIPLSAGSIALSNGDSNVAGDQLPPEIISSEDAKGEYELEYRWESSTDSVNWVSIQGATGASFQPNPISQTTYFRRRVTDQVDILSSNVITLNSNNPSSVYSSGEPWVCETTYLDSDNAISGITYLDGFGRPEQNIGIGASPTGKDLVGFTEYDNMGRADTKSYLPFATDKPYGGAKIDKPEDLQLSYYKLKFPNDVDVAYTFSQTQYDNLPLGTLAKQSAPGLSRSMDHGRTTEVSAQLNTTNSVIKRFTIDSDNNSLLLDDTGYTPGSLTIKKTQEKKPQPNSTVYYNYGENTIPIDIGQDGNEYYEYTDSFGRLVAKETKIISTGERRITYYVYDDLGRQRYIIPPIAAASIIGAGPYTIENNDWLKKYCYYTEYDNKGRPVVQYVPGAGYSYTVYDKRDRVAMTQQANMQSSNKWTFTKYDVLDRPIMTGIITSNKSRDELNDVFQQQKIFGEGRGTSVHGYTNSCYPQVNETDVLNVTYYDDYTWRSAYPRLTFLYNGVASSAPSVCITGLVTGTKSKVLGGDTWTGSRTIGYGEDQITLNVNDQWLCTATYYDNDYQVIQTVSDLYPMGTETVSNAHDFTGNVTKAYVQQTLYAGDSYGYTKDFSYDSWGRLQNIKMTVDGDSNGPITIAQYEYDELGNISKKWVHNKADETDYAYRLDGRLEGVTSKDFSYKLGFDRSAIPGVHQPRLDGNLSNMAWKNSKDNLWKGYYYGYDATQQLNSAIDAASANGAIWNNPAVAHPENGIKYDLSGNLTALNRPALGQNLVYHYDDPGNGSPLNGNAISKLTINGTDTDPYQYDASGNMTYDGYSKVNIEYNELGLPKRIFANNGEIRYIYSADGHKLAQKVGSSLTYSYYNSVMVYGGAWNNATINLQYMLQPEGLITRSNGSGGVSLYTYEYFKTDQVGSTRVVLKAVKFGSTWTLQPLPQYTDYYPFGLAWDDYNGLLGNKYLYGGKELQDAPVGAQGFLNLYDSYARFYNPMLGRWFNQDPAHQYANPYLYCGNSPMMYTDPDGRYGGWDDVVVMVVGGLFNWAMNGCQFNWSGLGYFASGAAAAELTWYGQPEAGAALLGGLNSANSQLSTSGTIHLDQLLVDTSMSLATSVIAADATARFTPMLDRITGGIPSPILKNVTNRVVTYGTTGFLMGSGMAALNGADFHESMQAGWQNAKVGMVMGGITGVVAGYQEANQENVTPLLGRDKGTSIQQKTLPYTDDQMGHKFGEHMDPQQPGYRNISEYRNLANDIYNDPSSQVIKYPINAPAYGGETHYMLNGNLLRIAPDGSFRSLYPIVK